MLWAVLSLQITFIFTHIYMYIAAIQIMILATPVLGASCVHVRHCCIPELCSAEAPIPLHVYSAC